jgi:hypothetical protein
VNKQFGSGPGGRTDRVGDSGEWVTGGGSGTNERKTMGGGESGERGGGQRNGGARGAGGPYG